MFICISHASVLICLLSQMPQISRSHSTFRMLRTKGSTRPGHTLTSMSFPLIIGWEALHVYNLHRTGPPIVNSFTASKVSRFVLLSLAFHRLFSTSFARLMNRYRQSRRERSSGRRPDGPEGIQRGRSSFPSRTFRPLLSLFLYSFTTSASKSLLTSAPPMVGPPTILTTTLPRCSNG